VFLIYFYYWCFSFKL